MAATMWPANDTTQPTLHNSKLGGGANAPTMHLSTKRKTCNQDWFTLSIDVFQRRPFRKTSWGLSRISPVNIPILAPKVMGRLSKKTVLIPATVPVAALVVSVKEDGAKCSRGGGGGEERNDVKGCRLAPITRSG